MSREKRFLKTQKTDVLSFTQRERGKEVTNVVKTARALRPLGANNMPQVVFYDWGVGSEGGFGKLGEDLEKIHPSVRQRMAAVAGYRPRNVERIEVKG